MKKDDCKVIMANNIKRYMAMAGVSNKQLCADLGFKYTTFLDWINGVTYPRIGKVEAMADYFGIQKSDLIEDKELEENKDKTDVAVDIVFRLNADKDFLEAVKLLNGLTTEQLVTVRALLQSLIK